MWNVRCISSYPEWMEIQMVESLAGLLKSVLRRLRNFVQHGNSMLVISAGLLAGLFAVVMNEKARMKKLSSADLVRF